MKKRVAIYPGTFDPITLGHLDVIEASSIIFDQIIVGLLINTSKNPRFTEEERKAMIEEAVADLGFTNVSVKIFKGLAVELAQQEKAIAIIRGLRLTTEYESELSIVFNNRILGPKIVSLLIPPRQEHIHISSTVVRELLNFGGPALDKYVPAAVLEHAGVLEKRYEERLLGVCLRLYGSAGRFIYSFLLKCYQEPHRAYHTLRHINGMLDEFEEITYPLDNPDAVKTAILFHDAVYDPRAKDNEEKSAELAEEMISRSGLPELGKRAAKLIPATKHDVPPDDYDAKVLVDMDLISLGCSKGEFDRNTAKIRKEYGWLTDEEFNNGRKAFFESLLPPKRKTIYLTPFFRNKYEKQARRNIRRAITRLSK